MIKEAALEKIFGVKFDTAQMLAGKLEYIFRAGNYNTMKHASENEKIAMLIVAAGQNSGGKYKKFAERCVSMAFLKLFEKKYANEAKMLIKELLFYEKDKAVYLRGIISAAKKIKRDTGSDTALNLVKGAVAEEHGFETETVRLEQDEKISGFFESLIKPSIICFGIAMLVLFAGFLNIIKIYHPLKNALAIFCVLYLIASVILYFDRRRTSLESLYEVLFK